MTTEAPREDHALVTVWAYTDAAAPASVDRPWHLLGVLSLTPAEWAAFQQLLAAAGGDVRPDQGIEVVAGDDGT